MQVFKPNEELVAAAIDAMQDIKAEDIKVIDLTNIDNAVCNYFIVGTGKSNTQVNSIAESVERKVRKNIQDRPWHVEGKQNGQWVLLDYSQVVVHIFLPEQREFYDIESLWGDATIIDIGDDFLTKN